jgi:hypothetical protein
MFAFLCFRVLKRPTFQPTLEKGMTHQPNKISDQVSVLERELEARWLAHAQVLQRIHEEHVAAHGELLVDSAALLSSLRWARATAQEQDDKAVLLEECRGLLEELKATVDDLRQQDQARDVVSRGSGAAAAARAAAELEMWKEKERAAAQRALAAEQRNEELKATVDDLRQQQQVMLQQHQQMNAVLLKANGSETARADNETARAFKAERALQALQEEVLQLQDQVKALLREREDARGDGGGGDDETLRILPAHRARGTSVFSDPLDDSVSQRGAMQRPAAAASYGPSNGSTVVVANRSVALSLMPNFPGCPWHGAALAGVAAMARRSLSLCRCRFDTPGRYDPF